jgi:hypothetical protein
VVEALSYSKGVFVVFQQEGLVRQEPLWELVREQELLLLRVVVP